MLDVFLVSNILGQIWLWGGLGVFLCNLLDSRDIVDFLKNYYFSVLVLYIFKKTRNTQSLPITLCSPWKKTKPSTCEFWTFPIILAVVTFVKWCFFLYCMIVLPYDVFWSLWGLEILLNVLKVIIVLILLSLNNNKLFRDLIIFSLIKNVELSGNSIMVWFVILHVSCFF